MLGGIQPLTPPSSPALVGRIAGGHSGFPKGTVHSFILVPPTSVCLTAHFIYDPKMNRPTEVPSLLTWLSWVSGGAMLGELEGCVYGVQSGAREE